MVVGDALCSFNPTYGQGMTTAALAVMALAECLREARGDLQGLPSRFYQRAAKVIDTPWQMAAGGDFAYPEVTGKKAPGTDFMNGYMGRVFVAATTDRHVCRQAGRGGEPAGRTERALRAARRPRSVALHDAPSAGPEGGGGCSSAVSGRLAFSIVVTRATPECGRHPCCVVEWGCPL